MAVDVKSEVSSICILYCMVSEASESDKVKVKVGVVSLVQAPVMWPPREEGESGAENTQLMLFPKVSVILRPAVYMRLALELLESATSR